jgi:hypothetical protein
MNYWIVTRTFEGVSFWNAKTKRFQSETTNATTYITIGGAHRALSKIKANPVLRALKPRTEEI